MDREQVADMTMVRSSTRTRDMVTASLIAALMAATTWISVPFGPVPVTLQTAFVLLAALLLAPGWAAASMGLYLALGAAGVPVFAGGTGGLGVVLGPTGGFLLAFPIAATIGSVIYRRLTTEDSAARDLIAAVTAVLAAELVIYAIGVPFLMRSLGLGFGQAIAAAVLPFLIPDALKAALAVVAATAIRRARR